MFFCTGNVLSQKNYTDLVPGIKKAAKHFNLRLSEKLVGAARFERATPRPPDVYSNRAELRPELINKGDCHWQNRLQIYKIQFYYKKFF